MSFKVGDKVRALKSCTNDISGGEGIIKSLDGDGMMVIEITKKSSFYRVGSETNRSDWGRFLEVIKDKMGERKTMDLKIKDKVRVRSDLVHARYGGFPARPEMQLNKKNTTGTIAEITKLNIGDKEIDIYRLDNSDIWYSKEMFVSKTFVEKKIILTELDGNLVFTDRRSRKLVLPKSKISLMELVLEKISKGKTLLMHESKEGNIYMNKSSNYEVFTELDGRVIELYIEDVKKYKEFLARVK